MGEVEAEGVGDGAPRKAWSPPTFEVVPMHDTEATFSGSGADGVLDYS
jgi:hypothetical protein